MTAAADAANAGTCLEDGNSEGKGGNVYDNLDEAVDKVLKRYFIPFTLYLNPSSSYLSLESC